MDKKGFEGGMKMDDFEKLVLDRIKKEMAKKGIGNRDLAKLLKGDKFKKEIHDVWISNKLSGKSKLKLDEFGYICEKLEINPAFIFLTDLNPIFMKTSIETIFKTVAKLIANELNKHGES